MMRQIYGNLTLYMNPGLIIKCLITLLDQVIEHEKEDQVNP